MQASSHTQKVTQHLTQPQHLTSNAPAIAAAQHVFVCAHVITNEATVPMS